MKPRDIGAGSPYSLKQSDQPTPFLKAVLKTLAFFFMKRSHELKHTLNAIQGRPPFQSYIIFAFSVSIPYHYQHQLTSASLLALASIFKSVPVAPSAKLKLLIIPGIYLTSMLTG